MMWPPVTSAAASISLDARSSLPLPTSRPPCDTPSSSFFRAQAVSQIVSFLRRQPQGILFQRDFHCAAVSVHCE